MLRHFHKFARKWHGVQNFRGIVPITSLIIVIMLFIVFVSRGAREHPSSSVSDFPKPKWNSFSSSVGLNPSLEYRSGTDIIWQIPKSPKAVLFLAHGCYGKAMNFWDKSHDCPNCIGLPEERLIVLHALSRKFAVLTISSAGECWSLGKEIVKVKEIIRWWLEKNKLGNLPLMAMGASSGGHFVSALAATMRFSSIVLMISEGVFHKIGIPEYYPPTLFVHMPKDRVRMQIISKAIETLRKKGIDVAEHRCMEFPLTPSFLSDRIPGINESSSVRLFKLFREKGFIDENGYLKNDGRAIQWKQALRGRKDVLLDDYKDGLHHIEEELNLAFAYHEMTSLPSEHFLGWFENHMT